MSGYVDVLELQPGQRILVGPGRIETVAKPSKPVSHGCVEIYTRESTILTGLPATARVLED